MTIISNYYIPPVNPSSWLILIGYIQNASAIPYVEQILSISPLEFENIKHISSFLFYQNVPLVIVIGYFTARYDVPENFKSIIIDEYINFNGY